MNDIIEALKQLDEVEDQESFDILVERLQEHFGDKFEDVLKVVSLSGATLMDFIWCYNKK